MTATLTERIEAAQSRMAKCETLDELHKVWWLTVQLRTDLAVANQSCADLDDTFRNNAVRVTRRPS